MRTRLRTLRLRDVFMFVAIGAVVAIVVVFIGRQLGVGGSANAEVTALQQEQSHAPALSTIGDSQPAENQEFAETDLTLTLSAPDICETDHGFQGYGIGETPVSWTVIGGEPPYQLEIDGETRDANHRYEGQTGIASVSCALRTGNAQYEELTGSYRYLTGEYVVDSGLKTINAVATDATGHTVSATVNVYIILNEPGYLRRGKTYRVYGHLFTVPDMYDLEFHTPDDIECQENSTTRCEKTFTFAITGGTIEARLFLYVSDLTEARRWQTQPDGTQVRGRDDTAQHASNPVDLTFDLLLESMDKQPDIASARP